MEDILVPIFICVILPVTIVWLISRTRQNETNRKAEIMLKAIESGSTVDPDYFKSGKQEGPKSIKQDLLEKLTGACITTFMGIAFLALFFIDKCGTNIPLMFEKFMPIAGGVLLAVGIGLFITYFVGKNLLSKEIEAEEKSLEQK